MRMSMELGTCFLNQSGPTRAPLHKNGLNTIQDLCKFIYSRLMNTKIAGKFELPDRDYDTINFLIDVMFILLDLVLSHNKPINPTTSPDRARVVALSLKMRESWASLHKLHVAPPYPQWRFFGSHPITHSQMFGAPQISRNTSLGKHKALSNFIKYRWIWLICINTCPYKPTIDISIPHWDIPKIGPIFFKWHFAETLCRKNVAIRRNLL